MGNDSETEAREVASSELKFGVDRILAIRPISLRASPPRNADFILPNNPPCSECVSSIFRCCVRNSSFFPGHFFDAPCSVLHAPKPIRPFSSLMPDREERVVAGLGKRKRSWSRAVFSNLQRKGLERRFQMQQYITKPDRRQLAATLGLTDAQVKVWFQNRRMKWRHTKEMRCHNSNSNVPPYPFQEVAKQKICSETDDRQMKLPSNESFASPI
ncbi:Homeobox domain [Nesidiocoris tenuis]|uniref:Homeobox domain n=1 Tax=Nesidiocoris tenuis TaxID=355587 RepID=A0ABN7BBN9_9HEMI|nr:Homeobox domain [Nesidiocoris tenuis]